MAEMKNICGKIPLDLHEMVRQEIEETQSSTQRFIQQVIEEHFSRGEMGMEKRTLAVQVSEELFGRLKTVIAKMRYYSGSGGLFAGLFGNEQIVTIAKTQLGNEGGQKFWSWYGFDHREPWCACFVSWCAEQSGLMASGSVPRFSYCPTGIEWFKSQGRWKDRGSYTPVAGTIIFFDWPENGVYDGVSDHVGIVERCENGIVYTVEGNSGDAVREMSYSVDSPSIMGYGLINFAK